MGTRASTSPTPPAPAAGDSPEHVIGLDLVFTGASGYSAFVYPGEQLIKQGLLDPGGRGSSKVADKIQRGRDLYNKLVDLAITYRRAIWVIEVSDWIKRDMPQRERDTLKSLALARGLAFGAALIWRSAIPICMGVNETRAHIVGPGAAKRAQFDYIRHRFQLFGLAVNETSMNITDAIALGMAFGKVYHQPSISAQRRDLIGQRLSQAVTAYQKHGSSVAQIFGSRSALRQIAGKPPKLELEALGLAAHLTPEYRKSTAKKGERWAAVDISATHPGVVVYDRTEGEQPRIVFHHTFTLERPQPDRKRAQSAYEIGVASNILRALAVLRCALDIDGLVFEYSDWHRSGQGEGLRIDRIAIDSLYFSYGALMAGAYHLRLPMIGVNATDAKLRLVGKKNATKAEMEAAVRPLYPFLKNEHTRDAAALMLCAHGTASPSPKTSKTKRGRPSASTRSKKTKSSPTRRRRAS